MHSKFCSEKNVCRRLRENVPAAVRLVVVVVVASDNQFSERHRRRVENFD